MYNYKYRFQNACKGYKVGSANRSPNEDLIHAIKNAKFDYYHYPRWWNDAHTAIDVIPPYSNMANTAQFMSVFGN